MKKRKKKKRGVALERSEITLKSEKSGVLERTATPIKRKKKREVALERPANRRKMKKEGLLLNVRHPKN